MCVCERERERESCSYLNFDDCHFVILFFGLQPVIFSNLASSLRVVIQNMPKLEIKFENSENDVSHNKSIVLIV